MGNPGSLTRSALAFSLAAGVAFLGSAMLLKAGRTFPALAGGAPGAGQPGILLVTTVILLATTGVLLAGMAARDLLEQRRRSHAR
ncbi:conserved hypothetical protein [Anaeromyxobacter dehalogenans 2CP-1]|uniref:Uncharacterized protein n=1 Tax=Anaeromyxobacter dehalogenans (strain ATCC BAA-258 / DSM 21875 / 2CP-1) TaxID=455488 RepID=B8JHK3_ANAD2|nr:hypothetical protein [Anaeromyxobacter dehalogenans]ACL66715.1 conserved hypothetical protein [Anaeromyxobacter dehalogenans 2CP-1]